MASYGIGNRRLSGFKSSNKASISNVLMYAIVTFVAACCIIPFIVLLSSSLTDETAIIHNGYGLWPSKFSTYAYMLIFEGTAPILESYKVTIIVTVAGTVLSLLTTMLTAYPLSRKKFKFRNVMNFLMFFTMLFNGGIVPWYILCTKYLGLTDNYGALIIPYLVSAWNVFLLRNFFTTVPDSIIDSAEVDGVGDYRMLFSIVAPIAKPGIATVALFISLGYWNDWWLAMMLTNSNKIVPLQLYLMNIIQSVEFIKASINVSQLKNVSLPSESLRMAIAVLAIGPIIFAYPFFQKYIVKGITIGAIKG